MNREILFRAKKVDGGEWVEGYLISDEKEPDKMYIGYLWGVENGTVHDIDVAEVDPDTICQYTGLTDKSGNKIFDGDVVKDSAGVCGEVKFGLYEAGFSIPDTNQGFYIKFPEESLYRKELGYWENKVVVIGNVYDNSELLEEESEK